MTNPPVPDQIAEVMRVLSLTHAALARGLGVTRQALYRWRRGHEPGELYGRVLSALYQLSARLQARRRELPGEPRAQIAHADVVRAIRDRFADGIDVVVTRGLTAGILEDGAP